VGASLTGAPAFLNRILVSKPMAYVAEVSYALYVIHGVLSATWLGSGERLEKYLKRPLLFGATFALAHLSTFYFEQPITRRDRGSTLTRSQRRLDQQAQQTAAAYDVTRLRSDGPVELGDGRRRVTADQQEPGGRLGGGHLVLEPRQECFGLVDPAATGAGVGKAGRRGGPLGRSRTAQPSQRRPEGRMLTTYGSVTSPLDKVARTSSNRANPMSRCPAQTAANPLSASARVCSSGSLNRSASSSARSALACSAEMSGRSQASLASSQ